MRAQNKRSKRLSDCASSESGNEQHSGKFQGLQAGRDLEANWEVDVAEKLEEYLLKICSGVVCSSEDVNFAEAALLLQGSAQVYSRKVEYLYGLVLRALEFLANTSHSAEEEQPQGNSESRGHSSRSVFDEDSEEYWNASDVPVESRNCLNASTSKSASSYHFVRPPSNLVVLEGDCLDASPDGEDLESFLLGTTNLYRNFLLLDSLDTVAVDGYLKETGFMNGLMGTTKGSHLRKSAVSPVRKSAGSERHKKQGLNHNQSPAVENCSVGADPIMNDKFDLGNQVNDFSGSDNHSLGMEDPGSDEDDPWRPLNAHEAGSLKVRPFAKVESFRRSKASSVQLSLLNVMFPLAKVNGTIGPELSKIWEARRTKLSHRHNKKSFSLYEKLRETLVDGNHRSSCNWKYSETEDNDFENLNDWESHDFEHSNDGVNDNLHNDFHTPGQEKVDNFANKTTEPVDPISQTSLEDLCRSHLDALLANIGETENQAELTARVYSWKQKIEHTLDEQESRSPFDIHTYGERILSKLSETDKDTSISFSEMVTGQEKHDVARTFSALLQLVNNGEVQLDRNDMNGESTCYSALNPFSIHLHIPDQEHNNATFRFPKKRVKSPLRNPSIRSEADLSDKSKSSDPPLSQRPPKLSTKTPKVVSLRSTPDGKRRRRSQFVQIAGNS